MMQRMINYQEESELFCFIANYHSLTSIDDPSTLQSFSLDLALDFLALGLDPKKTTFWLQSDVPEVTELAWILSQSITVPQLSLAHSYKDKVDQGMKPSVALFYYPVLMSADILAYQADKVPVGKDQKQHIEMCRDIAQRFNTKHKEVFTIPEVDMIEDLAVVLGIDGRKMSKSYKNTICPFAPEKELRKSIMSIVTDAKGVSEPKDPDNSILFSIFSLFLKTSEQFELADRFRTPGTGYGHFKEELFSCVMDYFQEARKKREDLGQNLDYVKRVLQEGAKKASQVAKTSVEKVHSVLKLGI